MGTITTTSVSNTPQAGDDLYTSATTGLTDNSLTVVLLNVMSNDLGGAAKTLYSLDSGAETTVSLEQQALLIQDTSRTEALSSDTSDHGASIWITSDGKVGYDASKLSTTWLQNSFNTLGYAEDSFTYAIRLGNGTLSWATARIEIAPPRPIVSLAHDTGASSSDGITNDPSLQISGVAHGATIQYSIDSGNTWSTAWSATEGSDHLLVRQVDVLGNVSSSSALNFTLDTIAPNETISNAIGTQGGATSSISSGGLTKASTLTLSGTVSDADGVVSVQIFDGNTLVGNATISGNTWQCTVGSLVEGTHTFTAVATDLAGNTKTSNGITANIDLTGPSDTISSTIGTQGGLTPTITSGDVTKANSLTLSGTVDDPNGVALVQVYDGTTLLGNATVNGKTWTFITGALTDGVHNFSSAATDAAGNTTTTSAITATIDTTPPNSPAITTTVPAQFNGTSLDVVGTAEANSKVTLYNGSSVVGTTTADSSGHWSVSHIPLNAGADYQFTATASDAAGNTGQASNPLVFHGVSNYALIADQASATEGNSLSFTVTRDGAPMASGVTDTVTYTVNGQNYTVVFSGNDASKTIVVGTADDGLYGSANGGTDHFTVALVNASQGGTASGSAQSTVGDAESPPSFSVAAGVDSATEGSSLNFSVTRSSGAVAHSETVNWSANGQSGTVTFAPGDTTKTFTVTTADDAVWGTHSPNVTATLTNPTDGAVLGTATANTALTEGDAPPSYSVSSNAASAAEGSALTFTVNRSLANGESVANPETVNWSANGQSGTVTFAAGDTSQTFTVATTDDHVWGTHSPNVTATISNPSDGAVLGTVTAATALTEGDAPPSYSVSAAAGSAAEGSALTFTVNRSLANGESVANAETVNWSANGQSGTVTFAPGDTSKTFTVATTDDQVWGTHSPDVTATLTNPTDGAVLGTVTAATALTEGDAPPSYSVSAAAGSAAEGSALTFTVNRSLANGESVANSETVNWSANGQTGTVTFAPGDTTKTFTVTTADDQVWGTHSPDVTATLTNPTDGAVLGTVTANTALTEGDAPPSYSVSAAAGSAAEGSALTFTVNRSLANGESVANPETVNWSANGQSGTVTFAAGDTSQTFTVATTDDQVWGTHSPNVTATISNPSDGAVLGTVTANTALTEGDAPPSYSVSSNAASATEGSALTFTVNRSLANGESVANSETVNWSANGQTGTVTFAPGDTTKTFTVTTADDQVWGTHSPDVTATISNPTDGAVLGTVTTGTALTEGDAPPSYSVSSNAASATEGSALTFTVNRSLANGESVANAETVSWSANGQSGTVTFAAGDTSQTFTVATTDDHVWGTHSPNVTATISNPTDGAVLGTVTAATALTEGDAPPSYSVSAGTGSAAEGSTLTFTVNRTLANGESVANSETVNWSANGQSGTVTFAAGDTSQTFTVATTDDQVWGTHSPNVTATISNPTDGAVLGTVTANTALTEGDAPPSYSVSAAAASATEGSGLTFTVNRSLANGESVANAETVNWSANGQSGTVTFAAGDTSQTFTVATTDDQVWGTHSPNVTATISNPTDGAVLGTVTAATALTEGDAPPSYSVSAAAGSAAEGSTLTFTVNRSLANGESVANPETVSWSANGQSGTVTFAAGDTSQTFTVATTDDHVWGTHSANVTATISNPTDGAVLGTVTAATALTEGDAPPSYSVSSNAASATEGSALTFTVNRSLANGESVANPETVNWSANGQSGTVTFAAGDTSKTFTVATTDDAVWGTHSPNVTATISNPTDGAVLGTATAATALTEGDAPPSYSVSSNAASATEGSALTFTVNRSLANGESVANAETVNWSANGQSGTVTFAAGDTSKTFTVATTDDQVWGTHSPNVTATISNPTDGAVLGTVTAGTALTEGDAPPSYSVSAAAGSAAEGSALTFTVNRTLANGESVANSETVNWSANGQSGTVTFAAGDTSKTFTVATTDDQVWGTQSPNVTATISNPTDGAVLGTATAGTALTEADAPPSYSVSSNAASAAEGSVLTFTVNRSLANGESVANAETVNWSANGQSGTVTFAAGDTSKTFTVATTDDHVWGTHSPNVTATISNPTDGAVLGTVTAATALTDADPAPTYSISANATSAAEGSSPTFTVSRTLAAGESVANSETVNWSANGQTGTVTFAAGDTSKTFTVATTDDHVWGTHSPNVTATISNPTDGAVLGTATAGTALTEGDAPPSYSVSAAAGSAAEGSTLTFTVNRSLANGESVANSETVNWSANGQSGTVTFAPGDTTKTFTVTTTDNHVWGTHSANVTATLSSPSDGAVLGTAAATTVLTDADPAPSYSISANAASATEGSALTFTVNRSLANGESVANSETVNWSANGQSGTVTFAAGDTSKTFTVATTDNHVWGSHSADVTATLSSPSDGAVLGVSAATTTLTEGDAAPIFSLSGPSSATKGTTVNYLVTRALSSGESVLNTETVHWSASGTAVNSTTSGTLTFAPGDTTEGIGVTLTNANNKSVTVTISNASDGAVLGTSTVSTTDPAGITGEPINLGLNSLPTEGSLVTVTVSQVPDGWTLNGGTLNSDGSWSIQTTDVGSLSITAPDGYTGARSLSVSTSWTNSDGTLGHGLTTDNVEVYAKGSPIFALSGDDHLTGSTGNDLFVFSQPIGNDVVYHFDPAADKIDLISYGGFTSFADVQGHLSSDGKGNAVLALADGQSITLDGVQASSLTDANFVFDQTPVVNNAGHMVIADGASMPLSGIISNTGTIELDSVAGQSQLQLIEHGITLNGGGQVILSDSSANAIVGTAPDVTLTNVDNTISGAGQLGAGELTLVNQGTISATGNNALVVDTGPNLVINSGTLEANGTGGLSILGGIENTGTLWADSGKLMVDGAVTGDGNALISGSATLEFGAASSATTTFAANASGTLKLDDVLDFTGTVAGFNEHDQLDLGNVQFGGALTLNYSANTAGTGGTLTVSNGTQTENIAFSGQYDAGGFHLASDGSTGTLITYTPSTLIPLDTTNHVLLP